MSCFGCKFVVVLCNVFFVSCASFKANAHILRIWFIIFDSLYVVFQMQFIL